MSLILNLFWFVLGGWLSGLLWLAAGVLLAITIVGLPWAQAAFRIGMFSFAPFGKQVVARETLTGREDLGSGPLGFLLNAVWFLVAGLWLAIQHVLLAIALGVTLIGIPFAIQHLKLAVLSVAPVGRSVIRT